MILCHLRSKEQSGGPAASFELQALGGEGVVVVGEVAILETSSCDR